MENFKLGRVARIHEAGSSYLAESYHVYNTVVVGSQSYFKDLIGGMKVLKALSLQSKIG